MLLKKRWLQGTVLIVSVIALSGCMVKRLLEFKYQMNNVPKYVDFSKKGAISFTKPILHLSDIELISGLFPSRESDNGADYEFNRLDHPEWSLVYRSCYIFEQKQIIYQLLFPFTQVEATLEVYRKILIEGLKDSQMLHHTKKYA